MLGLLDRFRKRKETKTEKKTEKKSTIIMTELEQLCGNDKETYEALFRVMFLDPRKIETSMKDAAENAKKFEKAKDFVKARVSYEIAGGLAIYEGDVKKVVEYFGAAEKVSPGTSYPILKNPEKAVAKAQEYYRKHLQA
jgi:hypothetical protein